MLLNSECVCNARCDFEMSDYVELDRLFIDYDESDQGENESTSFTALSASARNDM